MMTTRIKVIIVVLLVLGLIKIVSLIKKGALMVLIMPRILNNKLLS